MRILVVSDTHGLWKRIIDVYESESGTGPIDMIIHAGDYIDDLSRVKDLLEERTQSVKKSVFVKFKKNDNLEDDEIQVEIGSSRKKGSYIRRVNVDGRVPIFVGVKGNCDDGFIKDDMDFLKIIEFKNKKIIVTHGHREGVKRDLTHLYYKGLEMKADVVIFGHTHVPSIESDDKMTILNPGSLVVPRAGQMPTYCIIEYDEDDEEFKFVIKIA